MKRKLAPVLLGSAIGWGRAEDVQFCLKRRSAPAPLSIEPAEAGRSLQRAGICHNTGNSPGSGHFLCPTRGDYSLQSGPALANGTASERKERKGCLLLSMTRVPAFRFH